MRLGQQKKFRCVIVRFCVEVWVRVRLGEVWVRVRVRVKVRVRVARERRVRKPRW